MNIQMPNTNIENKNNEKVLLELHPTEQSQIWLYSLGVLIIIFGLLAIPFAGNTLTLITLLSSNLIIGSFIILFVEFCIIRGNRFIITNKGITHEFKCVIKRTINVKYDKITDVRLLQGLFGRLLNFGMISINTAGTTFIEVRIFGVQNPEEVEKLIREYWNKVK